jgi:hypothetical protein
VADWALGNFIDGVAITKQKFPVGSIQNKFLLRSGKVAVGRMRCLDLREASEKQKRWQDAFWKKKTA